MRHVLQESNEKTVISNQYEALSSTNRGLYKQSEYFNKEIASSNNTGYKVLRINQIVFSPQNLWMGNINLNSKFKVGMVSPSYKIFDVDGAVIGFIANIIKSPRMMFEYAQASEQGASIVRRNLDIDSFLNIKIDMPNNDEQQKIADFLAALDDKIKLEEAKLASTTEFKKALLQRMFV